VPVGGPPTTTPPPGAPPPPQPDPTVILTAVQSDLSQLTAITEYAQAKAAVASSQQGVTLAAAALQDAMGTQTRARSAQQVAQAHVGQAAARLRGLAVAAYMGLGYLTPAASTANGGQSAGTGTVSTPGGLTGSAAVDAQEMLRLVAQRDRKDVADTHRTLLAAEHTTAVAGGGVGQAQAQLATADSGLAASQQTLALVTKAATTPGVAASLNLLNLPGDQSVTASIGGSPATPASGASGLSALGAPASTSPPATQATAGSVAAATAVPVAASPTILGPPVLNGTELAKWFASTGHKANTTVAIAELAQDYANAGQLTGVRDDLAFAQSIIETGFFSFPAGGQLTPKDNNFAGIGACDSCAHGWTFADARTGVTAQLELLDAYASPTTVPTPLVGPVGVGGCCPTWMALAGKWASSLAYGISIMTIYHQMLTWVIPQRLVAAGLIAASPPAPAKGPTLATLPAKH
jgi:hypothetical protein